MQFEKCKVFICEEFPGPSTGVDLYTLIENNKNWCQIGFKKKKKRSYEGISDVELILIRSRSLENKSAEFVVDLFTIIRNDNTSYVSACEDIIMVSNAKLYVGPFILIMKRRSL